MTQAIIATDVGKMYTIAAGRTAGYETLRERLATATRECVSAASRFARGHTGLWQQQSEKETSFWALKDVSFELERGAVVGVIGANGAGKSTLLKLMSRITEPTRGEIRMRGRVGSLLEVGTGFHPELTGRENVFLNGAILGMTRREVRSKFSDIVEFAEVGQFIDTPVKHYSSGMYVRLAFAVAAFLEPEILLVDEALAVGDVQFQRRCLGKLRDIASSDGRTVLFVSHNMASVRSLCSESLWLHQGRLRKRGPSLDMIHEYLDWSLGIGGRDEDLSSVHRPSPWHGSTFRVTRLTLNDGNPVLHGEPLLVCLEYTLNGPASEVGLQIGFDSADGIRVMSIDSDIEDTRKDFAWPHVGSATAYVDSLNLQPGRYLIDLDVRSGESTGLDWLPSCATIHVLPGPTTPPAVFRDTGGVRVPGRWKWEQNEEDLSGSNC